MKKLILMSLIFCFSLSFSGCLTTTGQFIYDNRVAVYKVVKKGVTTFMTEEEIKASKLLTINTECNKAIVSGFKSSALGGEYFYYSTLEEQTILNSLINLGFDSNFKAQKISLVEGVEIKGERKQYSHTLAQLREILIAGATYIKAQIDKKDLLEIQINNATTAAELELINW